MVSVSGWPNRWTGPRRSRIGIITSPTIVWSIPREPAHVQSDPFCATLPACIYDAGMRAAVQRVSQAEVSVDGKCLGRIGPGFAVLLGVARDDTQADAEFYRRS